MPSSGVAGFDSLGNTALLSESVVGALTSADAGDILLGPISGKKNPGAKIVRRIAG